MKKIIFLDIDDTLADTTVKAIEEFNAKGFAIHQKTSLIKNVFSALKVWILIKKTTNFGKNYLLKLMQMKFMKNL